MSDRRGRADRVRQAASRFEPLVTKSELSGSLAVTAETQLKAQVEELQRLLTFEEPRDPAEKSDRLFTDAIAIANARRTPKLVGVSPSPAQALTTS